jgi:branched-chain amino acid transport system ATP-binding protein
VDEAMALLGTLRLQADADQRTTELPYGRQRLVEIALALATRPAILLLDEPAAGIPSAESVEVLGVVAGLPGEVTILFIEHDMGLVFRFAERITVLVAGRVLMEGTPGEVAADERVKAVYLGTGHHG